MGKLHLLIFLVLGSAISCSPIKNISTEKNSTIAFRLKPNEDLKIAIDSIVKLNNIQAGWIATCVGSLTKYNIRFANVANGTIGTGHFEIVSLVGTLSTQGNHIHISISDSTGNTIGGHLLEGCKIYTTAEIVLQTTSKYKFERKEDGTTPWKELQVVENKSSFD
jgi:predicted DNA-binding protein with PD1-like motif